jgi:hypothetical protein
MNWNNNYEPHEPYEDYYINNDNLNNINNDNLNNINNDNLNNINNDNLNNINNDNINNINNIISNIATTTHTDTDTDIDIDTDTDTDTDTTTTATTTPANDVGVIVDTDNSIKEFIGYKNQKMCDCWKLCNTCNLMHPLKFFINSQKYCYNCWGWKDANNFDLEGGKYIIRDIDSVEINEANDILKTVLQFYDKIDNKYKITDSIFNKIIHYDQLSILHEQFSRLLYKKNNLIFTGNKPVKIDYKNSMIFI